MAQGRWADSEAFFKRAIAIEEKLDPQRAALAHSLDGLGTLYRRTPRYAEAVPLHQRAIAIQDKVLGPEHPDLAQSLNDLGDAYRWLRRPGEAEGPIRRALAIREKVFGPDSPRTAVTLHSLALWYGMTNHATDEQQTLLRAIAIAEKALGPDDFDVLYKRLSLAQSYRRTGFFNDALVQMRLVVASVGRNLEREAGRRITGGEFEQRRYRTFFLEEIGIAHQIMQGADAPRRAALAAEMLETAQRTHASSAGRAVAGMAARFATGNDGLAAAIRERQDLAERWQRGDEIAINTATRPIAERDTAAEAALRTEQTTLQQQLGELDNRIARDFPGYAELGQARPVPLAEVQAMLGTDEALLVYLSGADQSENDATWLWAVRRDRIDLHRITVKARALAAEVDALRARLDPDRNPDLKPFDVERAYELQKSVLAPAEPLLAGARHVFVVPDGALQSLPIGVLVTAPPRDASDYRKVAWLARKVAVTTLPSVASLRALRRFARNTQAASPFIGVGDPALDGPPGGVRGVKLAGLFRGATADVDAVRKLPPLPDTANELRALAAAIGAPADSLYLRERASEATLKGLKLDDYRVIAFATHGLVAGDLRDLAEPALVLTPPHQASPDNDGLLTASEIAQLKLNADWVVLSACNTAAGDGAPGADGLSGLAKAFFYAGSRALLVSHWPVASDAAVRLTTGAFAALQREPGIGRAEALRRAELALLDDASLPAAYAHPMIWAPFVVVGEGGAS